jgi:ATP-dependent DNA helicase RecG
MEARKKIKPRELMEMAIKVMRESIHESREDNKKSPSVGAAILKPDGTIETAYRGELRYGDHAEFTLLERKNRANKLDGSILFTTLEPCAPGARRHPKLSCAERIVLARIKEVWVGVEDPDPTVDRKGIKYLQDNGITVHMFDRDLQKLIQAENKKFFSQALERAEEEMKTRAIILSKLELIPTAADLSDFSGDALEQFRVKAKIEHNIGSDAFNKRLLQQGILREEGGRLLPTGYGFLLFGKEPRNVFRQAGLLGTVYYSDGQTEIRDFNEPLILIPNAVDEWLRKIMPLTIVRTAMERQEKPALPVELLREGIVNALIHRDYDIVEAKCQLLISEDTITVKSPGYPISPITLEDMQLFRAPTLSRNPELHYVFAQMEMAEERGIGMETWKSLPDKYNLPLPKYTFEDPYLVLTLYRSQKAVEQALSQEIIEALNKDELKGWLSLASKIETTKTEYAEQMGFDDRKAERHLKRFVELGVLERVGAGPSTKYRIVRK